jgi:hypothetical protein
MARALVTLSVTAMLALSCIPANSQNAISRYGAQTCGDWMRVHQTSSTAESMAVNSWVLGYLEAMAKFVDTNRVMKGLPLSDALKGLDDASVIALVERFCRGNPRHTLDETVSALGAQMIASEPQVVQSSARSR